MTNITQLLCFIFIIFGILLAYIILEGVTSKGGRKRFKFLRSKNFSDTHTAHKERTMIETQGLLITTMLYVTSLIAMIYVLTILILPSKKLSRADVEMKFSDNEKEINRNVIYGDSSSWKFLREKIFMLQGDRCLCCGKKEESMHIDHIKPKSRYPHLEYMIDNLQVLCPDCNKNKSYTDETDYRSSQHLIALYNEVRKNKLLQRKYVYDLSILEKLTQKRFKAEFRNIQYPRILPIH